MKQQDDRPHELQEDGKYILSILISKKKAKDSYWKDIDMEVTSMADMTEDIVEEFARQLDQGKKKIQVCATLTRF